YFGDVHRLFLLTKVDTQLARYLRSLFMPKNCSTGALPTGREYPVFTGSTKTKSVTSNKEYGFSSIPYGCIGYPSSSILTRWGPVYPNLIHNALAQGPPLNENAMGRFSVSFTSVR